MQKINEQDLIDWEKYEQRPAEAVLIRKASHWMDSVWDRFGNGVSATGVKLPWANTWDKLRIRPGEVSLWSGINGAGKSLLLNYATLGILTQPHQKICIASMEMLPESTIYRMAKQALGTQWPKREDVTDFVGDFVGEKLYLYDQQGTIKSDRILSLARYCHEELGINHFVIDSLMKCGIGVDDYNRQKSFIDELCSHARDTGQHIHLVCHARKGRSEDDMIGKFDIKGASEITDQVDNVFIVWRNKPKENNPADYAADPDVVLRCCKQRHFEWEGAIKLWFDKKSLQYHSKENYCVEHYSKLMERIASDNAYQSNLPV
jgi:twinkle protein